MAKALIMQLYDYVLSLSLQDFSLKGGISRELGGYFHKYAHDICITVLVTFFFFKGEKKGAKQEVTTILIDSSLLTGQISVPASEDEVPRLGQKDLCQFFFSFSLTRASQCGFL